MTNRLKGQTQIEGLGLYQYEQAIYDDLMRLRVRKSLIVEVLERTADNHLRDGYRTLVRKLRKGELVAMVAEWETGVLENERHIERITGISQADSVPSEPETITVTVPAELARRIEAAWDVAYTPGETRAEVWSTLAAGYDELRHTIPPEHRWLGLALIDARSDAERRTEVDW